MSTHNLTRRQLLAAAGTVAAVSVIPDVDAFAAPSQDSGAVEITYFHRSTDPTSDIYEKWVVDTFNAKYAGKIHVTQSFVPDETYKTKQRAVLTGSPPPDVYYSWEGGQAKTLIDAGLVEPLDAYYQKYGWDKTLSGAAVGLSVFSGKKYFVPTQVSSAVFWTRPDIFDKYHVQKYPRTWDQLLTAATQFKKNGIAPFLLANQYRWPSDDYWFPILVMKYGVGVYQQLIDNTIPWTDPRVVDAWATLQNLVKDGYFYPGMNSIDVVPGLIPWAQGKIAMEFQGNWMTADFRGTGKTFPYPVDFFPWPSGGKTPMPLAVWDEDTLMIHSKSTHKDEAAEFINYYVSLPSAQKKVDMGLTYSPNVHVSLASLDPVDQRLGKLMASGKVGLMSVGHAFPLSIDNAFLDATQQLLALQSTPMQAAQATQRVSDQIRGPVKA